MEEREEDTEKTVRQNNGGKESFSRAPNDEPEEGELTAISVPYPCLEIVAGPREGLRIHLAEGENVIGRVSSHQIVLKDSSVSRRHAAIVRHGDAFSIRDFGSRNGTIVGGVRIESESEVPLDALVPIELGIYELRLLTEDPPVEEADDAPIDSGASVPPETPPSVTETAAQEDHSISGDAPAAPEEESIPAVSSPEDQSSVAVAEDSPVPTPGKDRSILKIVSVASAIVLFIAILIGGIFYYRAHRMIARPTGPQGAPLEPVLTPPPSPLPPISIPPVPSVSPSPAPLPASDQFQAVPVPVEAESHKASSVFLNIDSEPIPAAIALDDKPLGMTPIATNIDVETGKSYTVKATYRLDEIHDTFTAEQVLTVAPGQDKVTLKFAAQLATLKFSQLPPDVSVYLEATFDYDPYRTRSMKLSGVVYGKPIFVPFGQYIVELRGISPVRGDRIAAQEDILYRRGFIVSKDRPLQELTIAPRELTQFAATITTTPSGATIYYDDKLMGQTPWQGSLPLGKHALVLKKQGFEESREDLEMWRNEPQTIAVELKTSAAGRLIFQAKDAYDNRIYQKAIDLLSSALDQSPTETEKATINYWLGKAYSDLGECDKAGHYLTASRASDLWRYPSLIGLAECALKSGDKTKMLLNLAEVLLGTKESTIIAQAESLFHKMSPIRSVIYLRTIPAGATVTVNNREISDRTPVLLTELGVGSYRVVVKQSGYADEEMTFHVSLSEFRPIVVTLKPLQR